ncbi:MAG: tellurite resistance TerB family protein [Xanthomonadales bacterium]|nr:tellurite resistance TerB family protein [Xanthomonadales bacterium]
MNLNRIFEGLVSSGVAGGLAGGAASGLLVQGLGSKKGRKVMGKAAKLGGAAIIGGLAWKAYEQYRGNRVPTSAGRGADAAARPETEQSPAAWSGITRDQFLPEAGATAARRDLLVLRAMITAAHADGHIDTDERLKIYQRIESLDLSHAEKGLLMEEISAPLDLEQLVQQVPNRALAAEVYLAALVMADSQAPAHRLFLHDLAEQLSLPAGFVAAMHDEVSPVEPQRGSLPNPSPLVSPQA